MIVRLKSMDALCLFQRKLRQFVLFLMRSIVMSLITIFVVILTILIYTYWLSLTTPKEFLLLTIAILFAWFAAKTLSLADF